MKERYESLELEVVSFEVEDVIATSDDFEGPVVGG